MCLAFFFSKNVEYQVLYGVKDGEIEVYRFIKDEKANMGKAKNLSRKTKG